MKISRITTLNVDSLINDLFVRTLEDGRVEIYSIDFNEERKCYDIQGNELSTDKLPGVRTIAVGDVNADDIDDVIAGTKKYVLMMSGKDGKVICAIERPSPAITCDAGDVDGDCADEVVVAFRDDRVTLWNDGKSLFTRTFDVKNASIVSVRLENMTDDPELEVVVIMSNGNVYILSADGYMLNDFAINENSISIATVLNLRGEKVIVTGSRTGKQLKFWNMMGNLISSIELDSIPFSIDVNRHGSGNTLYMAVGGKNPNTLEIFRVMVKEASHETQKIVKEIASTKYEVYRRAIKCGNCGAPISPELHVEKCNSCGHYVEALPEYKMNRFISEVIKSVVSNRSEIKLSDLDRMVRANLFQPAVYHLKSHLLTMIQTKEIAGYLDGCTFISKTLPQDVYTSVKSTESDARKTIKSMMSGNQINLSEMIDSIEMVKDIKHGLDPITLRRVLMTLLAEDKIAGEFIGAETFILADDIDKLVFEILNLLSTRRRY